MQIPIPTLHLFPVLDVKLLELLRSLSPDEWHLPTRARQWTVKDIASHLLDGNLRTISLFRDGFAGEKPANIHSYQDLVNYLNGLNADWVQATKRLSPVVLTELLAQSSTAYHTCLAALDPFAPALFSVAWAGEDTSLNWFHIAREYTEKWHHQQQIREAVNKPGIATQELYAPVLKTFMQALPFQYRHVTADPGTVVSITITGIAGGSWYLFFEKGHWTFTTPLPAATEISLSEDTAWKLFTKGLTREEAQALVKIQGKTRLGLPVLSMLSVMA